MSIQANILILENWCVEKRKQLYFNDSTDSKKANDQPTVMNSMTKENLSAAVDDLIEKAWIYGSDCYFDQLIRLIELKKMDVDYKHSQTLVTVLMAACISSSIETIVRLLKLKSCVWMKSCNDLIPLEWAKRFAKIEVVELLECYA